MAPTNTQMLLDALSALGNRGGSTPSLSELMDRPTYRPVDPSIFHGFDFPGKSQSPSVLSRVFDVLSRPLYAVAEPLRGSLSGDYANDGSGYAGLFKGFWEGLSGQKKTRGSDVIIALDQAATGKSREDATKDFQSQNGFTKFALGLGSDVALDPITYVNPFSIASKLKGAKNVPAEFEGVQDISKGLVENNTPLNNQFINQTDRYVNKPNSYKDLLDSIDTRMFEGKFNLNGVKAQPLTGRGLLDWAIGTKWAQPTAITDLAPRSLKLPDGREIPLGATPNVTRNLTPQNVVQNLVRPMQQAQTDVRKVVPERVPTANELNFDVPATFRNGNVAPPQLPMPLPRTDYGLPFGGPRGALTAPDEAFGPGAQRAMQGLDEARGEIAPTVAPMGQISVDSLSPAQKMMLLSKEPISLAEAEVQASNWARMVERARIGSGDWNAEFLGKLHDQEVSRALDALRKSGTAEEDIARRIGINVPPRVETPTGVLNDINPEELAQSAGYKNVAAAERAGESEGLKVLKGLEEMQGPLRTARGFKEWKASRNAGMAYPTAAKIVEQIANGGKELPVLRETDQALANQLANEAIDAITKGGIKSPSGKKTWFEFGSREQANTWNRIVGSLKKEGHLSNNQINKAAYNIMRTVENGLADAGFQPLFRLGNGPARGMRLTDVIDELGGVANVSANHMTEIMTAFARRNPSLLKNPEARAAMERVIERDMVAANRSVERAVNKAVPRNTIAEQVLSPGAIANWRKTNLQPYMEASMRGEKASVSALSAAQKIIDDLNRAKLPVREKLTKADREVLNGAMKRGSYSRKTADVTAAQMRNLAQQLDVQWKQLGEVIGDGNKAAEAMRATIAAHWGMGDVRAIFQNEVQLGLAQATVKANYLASIAKDFSKSEINEAWRAMQGLSEASNPRILGLQRNLEQVIDTLISPVGVNSVARSSMTLMKDLNQAMRRLGEKFQFSNKADYVDDFGRKHDFSQNSDWLSSWKTAKVEEPLEFLLKVDTALEQVTHRYAAYDNLAARYGSRKFGGEYRYKVPQIDRLNGYYFPKEIAERLGSLHKSINDIYSPQSPLLKHFDNVMTTLKAGMTIYTPSHHIRNMIGDIFNSWIAGVNTVKPYRLAAKVIGSQRSRYAEYPGLRELTNDNALRDALTRNGDTILRNKSGVAFTAEQLYLGAFNRGLLQKAGAREEILGAKQLTPRPFGGRVQKAAHTTSELRDHEMRLAHFIDIVSKSKGKNINEIFEKASMEVRKWHPDGLDLTAFEKRYMRRIFPFYSWTRKAIPLMVEAAVKQPGKVMLYPKGMAALQQSLGIQGDGVSNPFPGDQLFPEWIREKGIGPIGNIGADGIAGVLGGLGRSNTNMFGDSNGYSVINPSNPFIDLVAQFGGMGRPSDVKNGALSMLNPLLKVPYELYQGKESLTGQPIEGREADYWIKQIPILSGIGRMTNSGLDAGPTPRGEGEGRFNQEAFLNWLAAMGVTGTGPLETSARIEDKLGGRR